MSLIATYHSQRTTLHSPLTTHHSPLATRHSPLTTHHSRPTIHHSPLTTHYSPLTTHHSPLTTHHSSPTTRCWLPSSQVAILKGKQVVVSLGIGKFFGERALLKDEPAIATVRAKEPVSCFCCNREAFQEHFGSLQELLSRAAERRSDDTATFQPPVWANLDVMSVLGHGTFGPVKQVVDRTTRKKYALKCISKSRVLALGEAMLLTNEKLILSLMRHNSVVQLIQTYQSSDEVLFLFELAQGGDLKQLVDGQCLNDVTAQFYVMQTAMIIEHLHAKCIIHRDLKVSE